VLSNLTELTSLQVEGAIITSGPLPSSLGSLSQLQTLRIAGGQSNLGPLPSEWGQLRNLQELYLTNLALTGQLPSNYVNLSALSGLFLRNVTGLTVTLAEWLAFVKRPGATHRHSVHLMELGLLGSLPADMIDPNRCGCLLGVG
jgi:hypothetical protein